MAFFLPSPFLLPFKEEEEVGRNSSYVSFGSAQNFI
jgi:hypothetical protein